ncbi:hypothetical protein, partial [Streptococcus pneumoniae]|uniref:hypothetical protein n=1 Tax=Streptococcus pneumoniae TaxID=1313 RepID=UPI00135CF538
LSLFIIGHMGLFFYTKIGSIISIGDLPTTNIIEPQNKSYKADSRTKIVIAILNFFSFFILGNLIFSKKFYLQFAS